MAAKNNRDPSLEDVFDTALKAHSIATRVMLPGKITAMSADRKTCRVQPLIRSRFINYSGEQQVEGEPEVTNVPICSLQAGSAFISMPVNIGDNVMLMFCDRSLDRFLDSSGEEVDPLDIRTHSLADAVAIPWMYPIQNSSGSPSPSNIVIGTDGGVQVHVKRGEIALGSEFPSDAVALASRVDAAIDKIVTAFNSHIHTSAAPGSPVSTSPTQISGISGVGSSKLAAE